MCLKLLYYIEKPAKPVPATSMHDVTWDVHHHLYTTSFNVIVACLWQIMPLRSATIVNTWCDVSVRRQYTMWRHSLPSIYDVTSVFTINISCHVTVHHKYTMTSLFTPINIRHRQYYMTSFFWTRPMTNVISGCGENYLSTFICQTGCI